MPFLEIKIEKLKFRAPCANSVPVCVTLRISLASCAAKFSDVTKLRSRKSSQNEVDRFHKIDFGRKQSPSNAMDLMYNHNAKKQPV
jgi:hypothetical protein